jgi:hypothetical protein
MEARMIGRTSKQIAVGAAMAVALALGLAACDSFDNGVDRVETGAAHVANWVSGSVGGDASTSPEPR